MKLDGHFQGSQENCELDHCWNTVIKTMHGDQCLEELWERLQEKKAEGLFFLIRGAYLFPGLFFDKIYFMPPVSNIYIHL